MSTDRPTDLAAPTRSVRWGRVAVLQVVAGSLAGFIYPFWFFILRQWYLVDQTGISGLAVWIAICIGSGVSVALVGAGIPLLSAWFSWLLVSRHRRGLLREVMAVIVGAIGGSLIPSALPFSLFAIGAISWTYSALSVLLVGFVPGAAFALWVAAAWRRARTASPAVSQVDA